MIAEIDKSKKIIEKASELRWKVGSDFHDKLTESIYADASEIANRVVIKEKENRTDHFDRSLDRILTSKTFGFPIMILILSVILWLTIEGANYPSKMLAVLLLEMLFLCSRMLQFLFLFPGGLMVCL